MADEYIQVIKAAWSADRPSFAGKYLSFSGSTFAPRPAQTPHPPIWVGGMPGVISAPALRRVALFGDAWHPLGLSLDDLAKGIGMIREMAGKAGRSDQVGFAPRNMLGLADRPKGNGRDAFEGSADEIATDIRRAQALGCHWLTFDLPRGDVAAMVRAMERFGKEVRPAIG